MPISVTPTLAKLFERLLLRQILEHVEEQNISKNQYRFLNKLSNETVISLTESINQLLEQNGILAVFF